MNLKSNFPIIIILGIVTLAISFLATSPNALLFNSKGAIALHERNLAIMAVGIMLIIVVPTIVLFVITVFRYRAGNNKAAYNPDWQRSRLAVFAWWSLPAVIVLILAIINWNSTHALDPFQPIHSNVKPLTVQVVALRWKWLFIYPEQNIATINFIQFPIGTPVNFELSADAPMSSFWIPQLGGQMYAMTGMGTQLHLITDRTGDFAGSAAEINGSGFSGMKFVVRASSAADFASWVSRVKNSSRVLDFNEYSRLVEPSEDNKPVYYASTEEGLYNKVIMKFAQKEDTSMHMQEEENK